MISKTTVNIRAANSIEEMQEVARNQIQQKIYELQDRINNLRDLKGKVNDIVDWESYERVAADVIDYGDVPGAVLELANEYGTMKAGNYF